MVQERRRRHTTRYLIYQVCGGIAIIAGPVPFFVYGVNGAVLGFAAVNLTIGGVLCLSARASERYERRAHFTYRTFFSKGALAVTKVAILITVLLLCLLVIPERWAALMGDTKWWAMGAVVALAVCGEALSDLWEVRRNIHLAVGSGNLGRVDRLLARNAELVDARGAYGRTPLHMAAALGRTDVAGVLLTNGADVNAVADGGWTALHWAAMSGRLELVRRLIEDGAEVNARAEDDTTPLHWAERNGHEEVAAILRWHGAEE
jgi:hypothetical protein